MKQYTPGGKIAGAVDVTLICDGLIGI